MIHWPAPEKLSKIGSRHLESFKKTAVAKDLEQDAREWTLSNWPWMPDAPFAYTLCSADDEERYVLVEGDGRWTMRVVRDARTPLT